MAWMSDEEYEFVSDSRQKKNVAASASRRRSHCGKSGRVRLPSDFMTKKEIKAMSGECITYRPNHPMTWEEFKKLADDLKVDYITRIRERFEAPDNYIAEMLGVSQKTLSMWLKDLKCTSTSRGKKKWAKEAFLAWRAGADPELVKEAETTEELETESVMEDIPVVEETQEKTEEFSCEGCTEKTFATPDQGQMTFNCPADQAMNMIAMVLGRAHVRLTVSWEVIPDVMPCVKPAFSEVE